MSRETFKEMQEVMVTKVKCDICGSFENVPRYAENRVCHQCGRDTCNKCNVETSEFNIGPYCKICKSLEPEFQPQINAAYKLIEQLGEEWKRKSRGGEA